jgi:hypothetical protein
MPFLARLSARFVTRRALFATHRGISVIFSFITPWVSIARGIEPEMPLIARRSAHFVTRRLISLPIGPFRYPQGYFGLFSVHYPGHVFALGIEAKVPSMHGLVMPGPCQGSRHGWPWLGKEGDHPPLYMHLELFPMWQEETSFRPRSVLAINYKNSDFFSKGIIYY